MPPFESWAPSRVDDVAKLTPCRRVGRQRVNVRDLAHFPRLRGVSAGVLTVGVAGSVAATQAHAWPAIDRFFTTLSAAGLTGLLAALAVVLLVGGYVTMRRVTV